MGYDFFFRKCTRWLLFSILISMKPPLQILFFEIFFQKIYQFPPYWWRLILEEYGPEIVYIKGIHTHGWSMFPGFPWYSQYRCYHAPKLDDILKMLVQVYTNTHQQHKQTQLLHEQCVCKSQQGGRDLPSHSKRDSWSPRARQTPQGDRTKREVWQNSHQEHTSIL